MNGSLISLLSILVAGYICRKYLRLTKSRGRLPYPPGPKPKPLIGNALEIPTRTSWLTYAKWAETYQSDILHAEALGQHIIILNSHEAATEILERRASGYSGRPTIPMLELMDWVDFNASLLPHGEQWQRHRRVFQQNFRKAAVVQYEPIEMRKVRQMLRGLLETPNDLQAHIRTVAAAMIMAIVYGHNISTADDKYVFIIEEAMDEATKALLPGASLVNSIPALRYIPPWFPGATFHRVASRVRELKDQVLNSGFELVRENMRDGTGEPSLLRSLLEANDADGRSVENEYILKSVSAVAYAAGADTTVSAVGTFFYAMATNPDVQRKAQSEIDMVIGNGRLPEPSDRPSLPYIEALYREVMRWHPVAPLGMPHASEKDDVYKGYFIPKGQYFPHDGLVLILCAGSTIFANIWAMTHDENTHKNPDQFQPERYFDSQGNLNDDDAILTFGFGRRVCVGRHLANSSIWLVIVSVLATLNIAKAKDSEGNDIEIEGSYTDGAVSHPHPFPCSITPRSPNVHELISSDE
ncbi:cytochrome P450 [Infundibulicybe gibba]|nr:cytochrome P450 [Infundibulicybe gibba]